MMFVLRKQFKSISAKMSGVNSASSRMIFLKKFMTLIRILSEKLASDTIEAIYLFITEKNLGDMRHDR
jgi:hypothetical protein